MRMGRMDPNLKMSRIHEMILQDSSLNPYLVAFLLSMDPDISHFAADWDIMGFHGDQSVDPGLHLGSAFMR